MAKFYCAKMYNSTDIRIIKTRESIFNALIQLMAEKKITSISITELCKLAMINRKTFYSHYTSISEAIDDLENILVSNLIDIVTERKILTPFSFNPQQYILTINEFFTTNSQDFDTIFSLLKSGTFLRKLGSQIGQLSFKYATYNNTNDVQVYPFALVFTLCGLVTSYFDWIDFGRQFPIEDLASISMRALEFPLNKILSPNTKPSFPSQEYSL